MKKRGSGKRTVRAGVLCLLLAVLGSGARAELVLSQLVVDLVKPSDTRADIEIWNNSDERAYVVAEPSEIADAGMKTERRLSEPDPEERGLLVSPAKMILEPGQRKLIRVAAVGARAGRERVYRLTIKPVTGDLSSTETGLKLLVGYDVLVLLRPTDLKPLLSAVRTGNRITFRNDGNASVELSDGRQCNVARTDCAPLQGKRLYAGAVWTTELRSPGGPVEYTIISGASSIRKTY